jgi:HSP90 family molecular chaperone
MPKFEVQITESRDLIYEVEAETADEAAELAKDMDSDEAVRDTFRERQIDWTMPLVMSEAELEDAVEREALPYAMSKAKRYTVEQQADGTHAIFCNGGFVKGGFLSYERPLAVDAASQLADDDEEAGVPVMARAE